MAVSGYMTTRPEWPTDHYFRTFAATIADAVLVLLGTLQIGDPQTRSSLGLRWIVRFSIMNVLSFPENVSFEKSRLAFMQGFDGYLFDNESTLLPFYELGRAYHERFEPKKNRKRIKRSNPNPKRVPK